MKAATIYLLVLATLFTAYIISQLESCMRSDPKQEESLVNHLDSITQFWLVTYTSIYRPDARIHLHRISENNYEGVFEQVLARDDFGNPIDQRHSSVQIVLRNDSVFLKYHPMGYQVIQGPEPNNYCDFIALLKEPLDDAYYRIRRDYVEYVDSKIYYN